MINERLSTIVNPDPLIKRVMSQSDIDQLKREVGERLKIAFETESYSEIGRQLEIPSVANTKMYVDGIRFPSPEVLVRFRARGFSLEWLFTGNGSKRVQPFELFSDEDEKRISQLARINGISFWEQVAKLTRAGLEFLDEIDNWKKS